MAHHPSILRLFGSAALALLTVSPAFAGSNIVINNVDPPGFGFNDPTPATPVGGNPGTTLGQQRLIAFEFAASIWEAVLDSDVDIVIQGAWQPLACVAGGGAVLGAAGTLQIFANFPGATFVDTWHHGALANKLAGVDLAPGPFDPGFQAPPFNDDITAFFNSRIGTDPICLGGIRKFYLGLDANHGADINLINVLLHEFGHGLGFQNFVTEQTGAQPAGLTDVYARRSLDLTTGQTWDQMTQAQRAASALRCDKVVWNGPNVTAKAPRFLDTGAPALVVTSPASVAGVYRIGTAAFGPAVGTPTVTADLVQALDAADAAGPTTTDGCSALTNAAAVAGKIALIDRGTCGFTVKVANAQAAGAAAVVIADNVVGCPPAGLGGVDPTITIPSARVQLPDGNALKTALGSGAVTAKLGLNGTTLAGADASNRVQLFMTNPVQPGSSGSHFDTLTFPNLLMEPAINADLALNLDLTAYEMIDIGWTLANVVIDGCDSGVPNLVLPPPDQSIMQLVDACAAGASNHGQFVSCVSHATNRLKKDGWISGAQKGAIQSCAGQADIP